MATTVLHFPGHPFVTLVSECGEYGCPPYKKRMLEVEGGAPQRSPADDLTLLVKDLDAFRSTDGVAYTTLQFGQADITVRVDDSRVLDHLSHAYYVRRGRPPSALALKDAVALLRARALHDGDVRDVHLRVAPGPEGSVFVDLGDDTDQARVTAEGWELVRGHGIASRRPLGMLPLPQPVQGSHDGEGLGLLARHLPLAARHLVLVLAWLVAALRPRGPYPIVVVNGEQGSGKSVLTRRLRSLVDPHAVPIRALPRNEHELVLGADSQHVNAFDNLSGLPESMADALCRMSTGGGFMTRTLYENRGVELFDIARPVILNGIPSLTDRADLGSRALPISLERIADGKRATEAELDAAFEADRPRILGGLLDALSASMRYADKVDRSSLGRMADFEVTARAASRVFPPDLPPFEIALAEARRELADDAIAASPVAGPVLKLLERSPDESWTGTAGQLVADLRVRLDDPNRPPPDFPRTARGMAGALARALPALREAGVVREKLPRSGPSGDRVFRLVRDQPSQDGLC